MAGYLGWYTELEPFYRVLVTGALLVGILALATGLSTDNIIFLVLGGMWLVLGGGVALLASKFEEQ